MQEKLLPNRRFFSLKEGSLEMANNCEKMIFFGSKPSWARTNVEELPPEERFALAQYYDWLANNGVQNAARARRQAKIIYDTIPDSILERLLESS